MSDIYGTEYDETLTGTSSSDALYGYEGNDTLYGGDGDDAIDGGTGSDIMIGGDGNDIYIVDDAGDIVVENYGEGYDIIFSTVSYTLIDNIEDLYLQGFDNINATGNSLENFIFGNDGNNIIDGGAGADILLAGYGDDIYYIDSWMDLAIESEDQGNDSLYVTADLGGGLYLQEHIENITVLTNANTTIYGSISDSNFNGNSGDDVFYGDAGNDVLRGNAGTDLLAGGTGNDIYVLNRGDGSDGISENDSTSGNTDTARFGESGTAINHDQLWFSVTGGDLEISVIGTSDKFIIDDWSTGSAQQIEIFEASDNYELTSAQISNLVSAMSSFSPPSSGTFTLDPGIYSTVLTQIASSWTT